MALFLSCALSISFSLFLPFWGVDALPRHIYSWQERERVERCGKCGTHDYSIAHNFILCFYITRKKTKAKMLITSVRMMIAKMAKNAITMRNDIDVRSRAPHVPLLLRFLPLPFDELLDFFEESFEYILSVHCSEDSRLTTLHNHDEVIGGSTFLFTSQKPSTTRANFRVRC